MHCLYDVIAPPNVNQGFCIQVFISHLLAVHVYCTPSSACLLHTLAVHVYWTSISHLLAVHVYCTSMCVGMVKWIHGTHKQQYDLMSVCIACLMGGSCSSHQHMWGYESQYAVHKNYGIMWVCLSASFCNCRLQIPSRVHSQLMIFFTVVCFPLARGDGGWG